MGTIEQKISAAIISTSMIKTAIIEKGVPVADDLPLREWSNKIREISTTKERIIMGMTQYANQYYVCKNGYCAVMGAQLLIINNQGLIVQTREAGTFVYDIIETDTDLWIIYDGYTVFRFNYLSNICYRINEHSVRNLSNFNSKPRYVRIDKNRFACTYDEAGGENDNLFKYFIIVNTLYPNEPLYKVEIEGLTGIQDISKQDDTLYICYNDIIKVYRIDTLMYISSIELSPFYYNKPLHKDNDILLYATSLVKHDPIPTDIEYIINGTPVVFTNKLTGGIIKAGRQDDYIYVMYNDASNVSVSNIIFRNIKTKVETLFVNIFNNDIHNIGLNSFCFISDKSTVFFLNGVLIKTVALTYTFKHAVVYNNDKYAMCALSIRVPNKDPFFTQYDHVAIIAKADNSIFTLDNSRININIYKDIFIVIGAGKIVTTTYDPSYPFSEITDCDNLNNYKINTQDGFLLYKDTSKKFKTGVIGTNTYRDVDLPVHADLFPMTYTAEGWILYHAVEKRLYNVNYYGYPTIVGSDIEMYRHYHNEYVKDINGNLLYTIMEFDGYYIYPYGNNLVKYNIIKFEIVPFSRYIVKHFLIVVENDIRTVILNLKTGTIVSVHEEPVIHAGYTQRNDVEYIYAITSTGVYLIDIKHMGAWTLMYPTNPLGNNPTINVGNFLVHTKGDDDTIFDLRNMEIATIRGKSMSYKSSKQFSNTIDIPYPVLIYNLVDKEAYIIECNNTDRKIHTYKSMIIDDIVVTDEYINDNPRPNVKYGYYMTGDNASYTTLDI